jgi:hypothetical protein
MNRFFAFLNRNETGMFAEKGKVEVEDGTHTLLTTFHGCGGVDETLTMRHWQ